MQRVVNRDVGQVWLSLGRACFAVLLSMAACHESFAERPEAKKPAKVAEVIQPTPVSSYSGVLAPDPRGPADLTVCSQNLKLLGTFDDMKRKSPLNTEALLAKKVQDLVVRFIAAKCDVIAVQEVLGASAFEGEKALRPLVEELKKRTNRVFEAKVAPPAAGGMGLGFLVATDRATILNTLSYARVELPKLVAKQRPRFFSRTPMEIQVSVKSRTDDTTKVVTVVNFHLKSKRGGEGDPTGLEWETFRMEMAEAFRKIIETRHQNSFAAGESVLVVVGDRNSNFDVASARILEGSLALSNFQDGGSCRVSKRGFPVCKVGTEMPKRLFSVLTTNQQLSSLPGTFSYGGEYSWLDDILMPAESLPYAWLTAHSEGQYDTGVMYEPKDASDHALVWVKLNW